MFFVDAKVGDIEKTDVAESRIVVVESNASTKTFIFLDDVLTDLLCVKYVLICKIGGRFTSKLIYSL